MSDRDCALGRIVDACNNLPVSNTRISSRELDQLLARQAEGAARSLQSDISELLDAAEQDRPSANLLLTDTGASVLTDSGSRDSNPDDFLSAGTGSTESPRVRPRRGRLDLAAVLYEVAPHCRLALDTGAGTEVFGNEAELRRTLQLMLMQSPGGAAEAELRGEVRVTREADWIRVSVELGPDSGVLDETERRWLHRVATKHGGRFELRGNDQCLLLPADASTHAELDALQRELEQAQMLGEAYARELANVFASGRTTASANQDSSAGSRELGAALLPLLTQLQRDLRTLAPTNAGLIPLGDVLIQLTQLQATEGEPQQAAIPDQLFCAARRAVADKAARRGVELLVAPGAELRVETHPHKLELAIRCLLDVAVHACEGTTQVSATSQHGADGAWVLCIEGPRDVRLDQSSPGWVIARTLCAELNAELTMHPDEARLRLALPPGGAARADHRQH